MVVVKIYQEAHSVNLILWHLKLRPLELAVA